MKANRSLSAPALAYGIAALLTAAGIALRALPPRVTVPAVSAPEPIALPAPTEFSEPARALLAYEEIVQKNVFDPGREPPQPRYVPPEAVAGEDPGIAPPVAPRGPRLFGLAVGPDGAVALIDADPSIPGAEVYRPGDLVRGLRLVEVTDSTAVLAGATGTIVLRLPVSPP